MPRIPQFQSGVQEGRTQARGGGVQAPRLTNPSEQEARRRLAREGQEAVNLAVKIKEKEIEKATDLAVTMAQRQYMDLENKVLYDRDTGYMNDRGMDAVRNQQKVYEELNKGIDDIGQNLSSRAKEKWNKASLRLRSLSQRQLNRHSASEARRADFDERSALLVNQLDKLPDVIRDKKDEKIHRNEYRDNMYQMFKNQGKDPEEIKLRVRRGYGRYAKKGVGAFLRAKQYDEAKKFYESFPDLSSDDKVKIEDMIKGAVHNKKTSDNAQKIILEAKGKPGKILDGLKKIKDPDEKRETSKKIKSVLDAEEDTRSLVNRAKMDRARDKAMEILGQVGAIPDYQVALGEMWDDLDGKQKITLERAVASATKTNIKVRNAFHTLSPQELRDISQDDVEHDYLSYLDTKDRKEAERIYDDAQRSIDKRVPGGASLHDVVIGKLLANKLIVGRKSPKDRSIIDALKRTVRSTVEENRGKTNLTLQDQWRQAIDGFIKQDVFIDHKYWPDPKIPAAAIQEKDLSRVYIPIDEIPKKEVDVLRGFIKKERGLQAGVEIPDRDIERAYAADILNHPLFEAIILGEE